MTLTLQDRDWIEQRARAAGFDLGGLAAVPDPETPGQEQTDRRFTEWVADGRAGEMDYLKRTDDAGRLVRGDLRRALPWARSVLVCALNYDSPTPRSIDPAPPRTGWIARYAWSGCEGREAPATGSDYHDVLLPRLRTIEADLKQRFGAELETRCYVDTGPIVERDYAARAGLGWIGKNTCLLNQQQGSWLLLGVVITSLELAPEAWALPAADRCGTCTRCIDACPTAALTPHQMDASRCIAYLTIEKKGSVPEDLRPLMGRQVFGCDICQDVCPWNSESSKSTESSKSARPNPAPIAPQHPLPPRPELINPALDWLASLDGPAFNRWFRHSPLERTRRKRFLRNVALAMGNSADPTFLPQLDQWAAEDDSILAEAAQWAAGQLRPNSTPASNPLPPAK